jgi:hypothetical protein
MKCTLFADFLHTILTFCTLYLMGKPLSCILIAINSSYADFLHTESVLCRLFADLMHTLYRVNVFHSIQHRDWQGPIVPFFEGKGAEVAVLWPPPPDPTTLGERPTRAAGGASALLGEAAAAGGGCRPIGRSGGCRRHHLRGRSAAVSPTSSIGYRRRRLQGLQTCARQRGASRASGQRRVGMREGRARDWAGQGQGLGASKQEGPARSRSGHRRPARERGLGAGPACGMGKCERASGPGRPACKRGRAGEAGLDERQWQWPVLGEGRVREPGDDAARRASCWPRGGASIRGFFLLREK